MKGIGLALALAAAGLSPTGLAAVADGNNCGGFTEAEAAAWLKAQPAQVSREVAKAGDKWVCTFAVGNAPAIEFSVAVASNAKRAADDLERYRDRLAAEGESARWKDKLPNGVYSDMFGAGDEAVWSDINGSYTVRRDNVIVQVTLPKGKERQAQLGKAVIEGF